MLLTDPDKIKGFLSIAVPDDDASLEEAAAAADREIRDSIDVSGEAEEKTDLQYACLVLAASKFNAAKFGSEQKMPQAVAAILERYRK